jgi:predicted secreted hydrolase
VSARWRVVAACLLLGACGRDSPAPVAAGLTLADALGGAPDSLYARAFEPRPFDFPADHGPHPEYRTEWWYITGNVSTGEGRRFGYQLTFFRANLVGAAALVDRGDGQRSPWRTAQAWLAHLALTDVAAARFHAHERFARGAAGLAGATAAPLRIWLEDWALTALPAAAAPAGGMARLRPADALDPAHPALRLRAAEDDIALELVLVPEKPPVFQGDDGLDPKGPEPGNASRYYSWTRVRTTGQVTVGSETHVVAGSSWLDREWGTTTLSPGVEGWDWFALQLDDGSELMLYLLRQADGTASGFSGGSFVAPDGGVTRLGARDAVVEPSARWTSPATGTDYPVAWRIQVPRIDFSATISAVMPEQELRLAVRYWEGAVDVVGARAGAALRGVGYVELTGYDRASSTSRPPRTVAPMTSAPAISTRFLMMY